jgi:putative spermidine/putrescine transport system permease protein
MSALGVASHRRRRVSWLLAVPGVLLLTFAYLMPMLWVLRMAFNRFSGGGGIEVTFTFDSFASIFSDPYYLKVSGNTLLLGVLTAVLTVIVAYPVSLFLARTESRWRGILLILAVVPMLVSSVARTYGWMVVLSNQGLLSTALQALGVTDHPVGLANNMSGVVIAMVQINLPYAVLVMTSGFGRLNRDLEQAAASLGANGWRRFVRVTVPTTAPGILSSAVLVFILAISAYVTPRLIGGGRVAVLASEIYDQATNQLNWPLAAALSLVLIVFFGIALVLSQFLQRHLERRVSGL